MIHHFSIQHQPAVMAQARKQYSRDKYAAEVERNEGKARDE
jgi:hypothetical protein